MMPGARRIDMGSDRAACSPGGPRHDGRARVVRIKSVHLGSRAGLPLAPCHLEVGTVARRIVLAEEVAVAEDRLLDEIARCRGEHWPPFRAVTVEQTGTTPALQRRRKLPG